MLNGQYIYFGYEGWQILRILNSLNLTVICWEKLRSKILRAMPVNVIKSFENHSRVLVVEFREFRTIDLILGIRKYLVARSFRYPLTFVGIVHSSIPVPWLNVFGVH